MLIWASIVHQPCVPHFQVFWHSQLLRVSTLTYNTLQWSTLMFSSCNCFIYETLTTAYFMGTKPVFLWFLLILHFCSSWFTKSCTHWLVFPLLNLPFLIQVLIHIQIWLIHQLNENSSDSLPIFTFLLKTNLHRGVVSCHFHLSMCTWTKHGKMYVKTEVIFLLGFTWVLLAKGQSDQRGSCSFLCNDI